MFSRVAAVTIVALGVTVVGLSVTLAVELRGGNGMPHGRGGQGFAGMVNAMGAMDSDAMMTQMRSAVGEARYQMMTQHMADHAVGRAEDSGAGVDGLMHMMMDGMMSEMPADSGGRMFPNRDMPGGMMK